MSRTHTREKHSVYNLLYFYWSNVVDLSMETDENIELKLQKFSLENFISAMIEASANGRPDLCTNPETLERK